MKDQTLARRKSSLAGMRRLSQTVTGLLSGSGRKQSCVEQPSRSDSDHELLNHEADLSVTLAVDPKLVDSSDILAGVSRSQMVNLSIPQDAESVVQFKVPQGVKPGDKVMVACPDGGQVQLKLPPDAVPGKILFLPLKKEAKFAAWMRRKSSFAAPRKSSLLPSEGSPAVQTPPGLMKERSEGSMSPIRKELPAAGTGGGSGTGAEAGIAQEGLMTPASPTQKELFAAGTGGGSGTEAEAGTAQTPSPISMTTPREISTTPRLGFASGD
eukprot:CAMPEP_0181300314 /NCGR_PEP_ID=MMETSP1101-20121128/6822_1 /TAXON_ID=46948 /ORGANISM="Rhodomonas abbreviata, Strain Caron Lab Isolate" /LENGTH=268 /DNA_ID=CAMNT_0023405539 /DNA_START=69 /DNA_END=875 /DNA_ORIENTATION=+